MSSTKQEVIALSLEEDRATVTDDMYRLKKWVKFGRVIFEICKREDTLITILCTWRRSDVWAFNDIMDFSQKLCTFLFRPTTRNRRKQSLIMLEK